MARASIVPSIAVTHTGAPAGRHCCTVYHSTSKPPVDCSPHNSFTCTISTHLSGQPCCATIVIRLLMAK